MEEEWALDGFAALAQSARLRVFRLLVESLPLWLPAGEIAERAGLPPSTLSFHLDRLARAGLVRSHRRGRSIRYAADCQAVGELIGYLTDNCCRGARAAARPTEVSHESESRHLVP
jgi:DNA-binding transcriptional ArsR family regulator